jgi:hypothetical protein
MSVLTSFGPGEPCWVAVSSASLEESESFYCDLFGWTCEEAENMPGYGVFALGGRAVAGAEPARGPVAGWFTYFASTDLQETARLIRAGGGVVVEDGRGDRLARTCVAADPSGGVFGVWEGGPRPGGVVVDEPGSVTWNELRTEDAEAASAFYAAVFGWRSAPHEEPAGGYQVLRAGTRSCGIWQAAGPARWDVYFAVEDADATAHRALELGGAASPARDTPYGRTAVVRDPLGAPFGVIEEAEASVA